MPITRTRVEPEQPIYAAGQSDDALYLIEHGQVKLYASSAGGRECLLAIYGVGDIFGESCFLDPNHRPESAAAMMPTILRRASRRDVVDEVTRTNKIDLLLRHLAHREVERQESVFDLMTLGSEKRLAKILLQLAERLGRAEGDSLSLDQRISHEDLAQMVGTTRPRVTAFIQRFRQRGLVDSPGPRSLRIHRQKVKDYLAD